mmetsp:Transcript_4092/g.12836  ORF Transcript_4092/g.12836 Transcript_4092/m.12836 type:complete len:380 (+) Transcript_4092:92-1231(+)
MRAQSRRRHLHLGGVAMAVILHLLLHSWYTTEAMGSNQDHEAVGHADRAAVAHTVPGGGSKFARTISRGSTSLSKCKRIGDGSPVRSSTSATGRSAAISTPPRLNSSTVKFINAGQGTTGTSDLYHLMCRYGIPSIHWSSACNLGREVREQVVKDQCEIRLLAYCLMLIPGGSAAQLGELLQPCHQLKLGTVPGTCKFSDLELDPGEDPPGVCLLDYLRGRILQTLSRILDSGVVSLHDMPYPDLDLVGEILALVPDVKVFLSLRAPKEWAASRFSHHKRERVCMEPSTLKYHNLSLSLNLINCQSEGCKSRTVRPFESSEQDKEGKMPPRWLDAVARCPGISSTRPVHGMTTLTAWRKPLLRWDIKGGVLSQRGESPC